MLRTIISFKGIRYSVKHTAGQALQEGKISSTQSELDAWIETLPNPG
jgi:hypothetical protein